jgi:DNA adenine methylase
MKPLIKWSGGKADELDKIMPHIPDEYDTYVEPFVGGGALYFHLEPEKAVVNDIHKELATFYGEIKNGNGQRIFDFMQTHPNDDVTYYNVRDRFIPANDLDVACKFYYLRKTCYRGMLRYNSSGGFNIPFGRYKKLNYDDVKNQEYENLFRGTQVLNQDFEYIFQNFDNERNFCFIDQPYDSKFTDYGYCKFAREDQTRLANCFKNASMKCLMVVGETEFIRNLYDGYIVDSYPKKYRFKLHSGRIGNDINNNHLIIRNY